MEWAPQLLVPDVWLGPRKDQALGDRSELTLTLDEHVHYKVQWSVAVAVNHVGLGFPLDQHVDQEEVASDYCEVEGASEEAASLVDVRASLDQEFGDFWLGVSDRGAERGAVLFVEDVYVYTGGFEKGFYNTDIAI